MCGRFALNSPPQRIAQQFSLDQIPELFPRYNITPGQVIPVVRHNAEEKRELVLARWGLIPAWSKEPKIEYSTINARAETVASKPAFRSAFRSRRCLVPADAYFEWQKRPGSKLKQPFLIGLKNQGLFAFAGLWEHWHQGDIVIESCTIIVTDANALTQSIHDRMPVILDPSAYDAWLDRKTPVGSLQALLKPYDSDEMGAYPVSTLVNNPRHDDPQVIEPAPALDRG